ncbi:PTS system cellobiose-specific IIC component [Clostridium saccharoperbutylacetonicum]|uniref:Permease IIC component n=2 Tax=Clostridium TaxID=1485 RepID=M1MX23_9CLOT|nr:MULTISPECIES: PTS sugar transporter subunit IIC [Clostridium]AGF59121.1 PTS system, lactose/cellobiose family IIC component [Clostridium saccharoperbutylacetonicum N1-4(HMT)]NRT60091.1 PTS system cellobiose-specific IIC component [Clostridium saccharoperbutylacetonicum]NSB23403.1 PTS system cellobiose-specific IIC component [Clostridium saccharoperbutylacetonicum]NSB42773.1 PTS system cellobiose-specific IIC component [Clostridium saccharoperbutylacetonicum]
MSSFGSTLNEKVIPVIMKFVGLKGIVALKDGILYTLPIIMVGSIFLLLAQIPYKPFNDWMASMMGAGWTEPLLQAYGSSFAIIALIAVVGIAYTYAKNDGHEPLSSGIIALVVFLLTMNASVTTPEGVTVGNVINKDFIGGKGMVTAIIIGLLVGAIYSWFMAKKITIKMPAGVPQGVANSFAALIPAAVIITGATVLYAVLKYGMNTTFIELIYKVIQTPLQGISDSLGGVLVMSFLIPFLWWFGVHGSTIVGGIMTGILTSNTLENQAIIQSGKELTIANGGHIVTQQFLDNFVSMTGAGVTIGLVLCMIIFGKSAQSKELGKLAIVPGCFNINEPVTFGTPIVMNPFMAIPFIISPMVTSLLTYLAISTGMVPLFTGVMVPWTTPPVISGFILGGWRTALLQIVIMAISFFIYLPFFKKQDAINVKNEQAAQ